METNLAGRKVFFADHTWKEMDALNRAEVRLILPTGSVEEHGPHLTLASDSTAAQEFCLRAARQVDNALILPCIWYSTCVYTSNYTGTISVTPSTLVSYVVDILTSLYRQGFRKLIVANVHGGAKSALDMAVREFHARMGTRDAAYADDFFIHMYNLYSPAIPYINTLVEGEDWGHACEIETSVDMFLYPERVYPDRLAEDYIPWEAGYEWYVGDMRAVDAEGVHGDATKASAAKGEKVVNAVVKEFVEVLRKL